MGRIPLFASMLLMQISLVQTQAPALVNPKYITVNPTQTTIIMEKPYCRFTEPGTVYLYAVRNGVTNNAVYDNAGKIFTLTYVQTNGGSIGPYQVISFGVPSCTKDIPFENLTDPTPYVIRVGDNTNCLNDPNSSGPCNAPLLNGTAYRFKYVLADSNGIKKDETDWSLPITTKNGKDHEAMDSWPGRRSGGMIVLTSILSTLLFFLLVAFVAAVVANFMTEPSGIEATRQETRPALNVPQKPQTSAEAGYTGERERYAPNPQA
ncbi:uroplakin-3a [Discoglossus pictus]